MDLELQGKVAIVTGASRGLGLSTASALAAEGANVVAAARSVGGIEELQRRFPDQVRRHAYDAADPEAGPALAAAAIDGFGTVDVLVNNAGVAPPPPSSTTRWTSGARRSRST